MTQALPALDREDLLLLRACFALGETGHWDFEAVRREMAGGSGMDEAAIDAAIERGIARGVITLHRPGEAEILPFPRAPRPAA